MDKITCSFETVTPKTAQEYLDTGEKNRRLRSERITLYANMISRGGWLVTNQGIGFDEHGHLIDGQHRLSAIVLAKQSAKLLVVRGLSPEAQLVLDQPAVRTMHEQMALAGDPNANPRTVAIAKQMFASLNGSDAMRLACRDIQVVEQFYRKYRDGIDYAHNCFNGPSIPGVTTAPVLAPIARAYYLVEGHEILNEFSDILQNGLAKRKTQWSAIALRNWLMRRTSGQNRERVARLETYKKTEIALDAFIKREPIQSVAKRETSVELFPLPSERRSRQAGAQR